MGTYNNKILFVDDEPKLVKGMKMHFYKMFSVATACSGDEALRIMDKEGPFAVIVSDMRMPAMSGVELLGIVKKRYPETVRIMLTGNAFLDTAIKAVNEDNIYKFLTKPCSRQDMQRVLESALSQYHLLTSEKELLYETLRRLVKMYMNILSLANPIAFAQADRVKALVYNMADILEFENSLSLELATIFVKIGTFAVPSSIVQKTYREDKLTEEEKNIVGAYTDLSYSLIEDIPRLEKVAEIIQGAGQRYVDRDASALSDEIFLGAEIIKVALDLEVLLYRGMSKEEAVVTLKNQKGDYSPMVLEALDSLETDIFDPEKRVTSVNLVDLEVGMRLEEDIKVGVDKEIVILTKGQEINPVNQKLLYNYAKKKKTVEMVVVSKKIK